MICTCVKKQEIPINRNVKSYFRSQRRIQKEFKFFMNIIPLF